VDRREVDFVVTETGTDPVFIECKWGDSEPAPGLRYLKARFPKAQAWQISATGSRDYRTPEGIRVCPARAFLSTLV
jgi:hypothetical protein